MTVKGAKKRLLDSEEEVTWSQRLAIVRLLNKYKKLTIEEIREKFEKTENVAPYLNSNEIMDNFIEQMFLHYKQAYKDLGLIED